MASSSQVILPARPGSGTLGRPIRLRANHFLLNLERLPALALYTVVVCPPDRPTPTRQKGRRVQEGGAAKKDLPKRTCRCVIRDLCAREGWLAVAYDGASALFAPTGTLPSQARSLPEGVTYAVKRPADVPGGPEVVQEGDDFAVSIVYATTVDVSAALAEHIHGGAPGAMPTAALQALDAVMRQERAMDAKWLVAGSAFVDSRQRRPLGGGSEVWLGYSQSARPTQGGTHLVLDRVGLAYISPMSGVERFCAVLDQGGGRGVSPAAFPQLPLRQRDYKTASAAFKGVKVELTHFPGQRRTKVCRGLSRQSARDIKFRDDKQGGKNVSVSDYFASTYGVRLARPDLPCVVAGSSAKPIYFPLEVCNVPEQRQRLLTDARVSSELIRASAVPPGERRRQIEEAVSRHVAHPRATHDEAFGIVVSNEMVRLEGRVLTPPKVMYKGGKILQPSAGAWNLKDLVLLNPPTHSLNAWALVTLDVSVPDYACQTLASQIHTGMQKYGGIQVKANAVIDRARSRDEPPEDVVRRAAKKGAALVVVLLPPFDNKAMYNAVKYGAELDIGVQTQCLINKWRLGQQRQQSQQQGGGRGRSGRGARGGGGGGRGSRAGASSGAPTHQSQGGPNEQFISNLVLKLNAKLGGLNNKVSFKPNTPLMRVPTLVFGADVSHAAPGSTASSIAAVVGSLDEHCARYAARLSAQACRKEMIEDLEHMSYDIALAFFKANGGNGSSASRPARVIFYRDGVSEGQFQAVLHEELPALRRAFARLGDGSYNPPVTYLVAQKRHNTRLFVDDPRDGEGRNGCVPAGTVVDSVICHPREHDFFLQSHSGIQGTTRPVHYHVLCDENEFGADAIQTLTFALTHLYCRCTRSVSLVPPVYYAHLAAARGAVYERASAEASDTSSVASALNAEEGPAQLHARTIALSPSLNDAMYFV